jgi:cytochrome P450
MLDFSTWLILIILAAIIYWYVTTPSNLPPGPIGLPILGSALDTWYAPTLFQTLTDWVKEYGPIYKVYVGNQLVLVLGNYDAIHQAMVKQGDVYAGRPNFHLLFADELVEKGKIELLVNSPASSNTSMQYHWNFSGLVNSNGELWQIHRRFALSTLRDLGFGRPIMEPRIKEEAESLLAVIASKNGKPFDIVPFLANSVSNVVCSLVFGKRFDSDDEKFKSLISILLSRFTESPLSFLTPIVLSERVAKLVEWLPMVSVFQIFNFFVSYNVFLQSTRLFTPVSKIKT